MIKPRMQAAGADMTRVKIIGRPNGREFDVIERIDNMMGQLEAIIAATGRVRAVLVDPITDFGGAYNLYREEAVRQLLSPFAKMAARYNIAVINVLHLNKYANKPIRQRILGSVALVNASRSVLIVAKDRNGRRFVTMEKANLWPQRRTVAFRLVTHDGQPRVEWDAEWEDHAAVDLILQGKAEHITKQQQATFILLNRLADGPILVKEIEQLASDKGMHWNTFKAAKREIGAISIRRDDKWWWQLPIKRIRGQS
jgi:hypothetical protein